MHLIVVTAQDDYHACHPAKLQCVAMSRDVCTVRNSYATSMLSYHHPCHHPACSALVAGQARGKVSHTLSQLCFYNFVDVACALGVALLVNVAVLLVSAATFHQAGEAPCKETA